MKRYVDVDKFIEDLGFENTDEEREENVGEIVTLEDFDRQPIVDVVEVIRCKECKSGICVNDRYVCKRNAIYDNISKEFHGLCAVEEDHFCSYGER